MIFKLVTIVLMIGLGIGGFFFISGTASEYAGDNEIPTATKTLISIMPFIFAIIVILGILNTLGADTQAEQVLIQRVEFNWIAYGERLKEAYAANFGGSNPGFNDEVDLRIDMMINVDRGFRRQLSKDWLKRMSKFVGVDWLKLDDNLRMRG